MTRNKFPGSSAVDNPVTRTADDIRDERIEDEILRTLESDLREERMHEAREEEWALAHMNEEDEECLKK